MPQERRELIVCLHQEGIWAVYIRCEYDIRYDGFTAPIVFVVITEPNGAERGFALKLEEHPHLQTLIDEIDWNEVFETQVIDERFLKSYRKAALKTGRRHWLINP